MVGYLVITFLIWRIGLFSIAWFGEKFVTFVPSFPYSDIFLLPSGIPKWMWSFANFDGVHYLTIAKSGYSAQFTQVFFPLYPLFIKITKLLFPFLNSIIVGLTVSNIFYFFSLVTFWKLLRLDYSTIQVKWIILFLLIFPHSFFFASLYTESLFLFLILTSFYMARLKKWWMAGFLGALASGTRLVGIFLLPALLWEWHKYRCKMQNGCPLVECKITIKKLKSSEFYRFILHSTFYILHSPLLYLVPLGLISYMLYLQWRFGDWLYFWHVQPVFGAARSGGQIIFLPQVIWRYTKILTSVQLSKEIFWISLSELVFSLSSFILLIIAHVKRIRLSYLIFSWLAVITPTLTGTFSSMPRYILVAFPIFIVLGLIRRKTVKYLLFVICCLLSVIFTLLFTGGHWVA